MFKFFKKLSNTIKRLNRKGLAMKRIEQITQQKDVCIPKKSNLYKSIIAIYEKGGQDMFNLEKALGYARLHTSNSFNSHVLIDKSSRNATWINNLINADLGNDPLHISNPTNTHTNWCPELALNQFGTPLAFAGAMSVSNEYREALSGIPNSLYGISPEYSGTGMHSTHSSDEYTNALAGISNGMSGVFPSHENTSLQGW